MTSIATQYQRTVLYQSDDYFEATAAQIASSAQLVAVFEGADLKVAIELTQEITQHFIVLGTWITIDEIKAALKAGFKTVSVLVYEKEDAARFLAAGATIFGIDEIYEVLAFNGSMAASIALEQMMLLKFPHYESPGVKREDATNLKMGIDTSGRPFVDVMSEIVNGWSGLGILEEMTTRGKMFGIFRKQIAKERVSTCATPVKWGAWNGCAIPTTEFISEVKEAAVKAVNPETGENYQFGLLYRFGPHPASGKTTVCNRADAGYHLALAVRDDSGINALEMLMEMAGKKEENCWGVEGDAGGWCDVKTAEKVLPFLMG